jgi:ataxia telangiectasia mutated family protein
MDVLLKLKVVPFAAVSGTVQSMLMSVELSGPALLTESSSSLMTTVMMERMAENPTHYNQTAERILNWLMSKWTPSGILLPAIRFSFLTNRFIGLWAERTYSEKNAHHCTARDVLQVLHACFDRPFKALDASPVFVLGPVAQARVHNSRHRSLVQYLLLLEDQDNFLSSIIPSMNARDSTTTDHSPTFLETKVLEFCISEFEKVRQRWKEWTQNNAQGITSDMLRIVTNFCVVASALSRLYDAEDYRSLQLGPILDNFLHSFAGFLAKRETEQYKVDAVLEVYTKNLPDIRQVKTLSRMPFQRAGVFELACHLSKALDDRFELKQSFYAEEVDFMDIDQEPGSQMTGNASNSNSEIPRHELQADSDPAALRAVCSAYSRFISVIGDHPGEQEHYIPEEFVAYLVSLHEVELLRSRQFVAALFSNGFRVHKVSFLNLLERLQDALIDPRVREHNTSEVANGMVVDVLVGTLLDVDLGATDREGQDLYENVEALYAYYVKGMEKSGVRRSQNLQKSLAGFLHGLLKHQPEFAQNSKSPSVRTSLFELLTAGEIAVKYSIAEQLPSIFEGFVLSEHDKIFQDIDNSLPTDATWDEGIAIRLIVLAKLASRWHTLLRQSIYNIFATAGSVDSTVNHARWCMGQVAKARDLATSQELFRLFAPQIIFTWLDRKRTFAQLPFRSFNYTTLVELLRDVESEAVGQAIMLGLEVELEFLAKQLGQAVPQMLTRNIGKAAAYTISWDTCKGSARNRADPSNAVLLRELVGPQNYGPLIQEQFPRVLGYIFQTIDHEEKIAKPLEKRPAFEVAAKALAEISNICHSSQDFDLGIEPSFSTHYLFDQLERLCRRSGDDPVDFWTPSNYTFVMRMLLDRIHPALGSLHARSIIRKIRIVVALAGQVAYEGYPLQMTLQSLRPFLTDTQCAEDTLGIMQYLFAHGSQYLRTALSFITGIGLSILISVRVFLGSSQDSTTQQSQHTATMNKAQRFHAWLTAYLHSHAESLVGNERGSLIKAFKRIITAASNVRAEGNSLRGSDESKLLLEILDDVRSGRKLLNRTSREVALDLLCQNFQPSPTARDDVLGNDMDVAEYAPHVWESCQRSAISDDYLLWASKVLGRAFSAHGEVKRSTDQSRPWSISRPSSKDALGKTSREAIMMKTLDLFYSDNRKEVSLAEGALRLLISRLSKEDTYLIEMQKIIPAPIGTALNIRIPAEPDTTAQRSSESLDKCILPAERKPVAVWIKGLAVSLCQVAFQNPILSSLSRLLLQIDQMAEKLFPYILHLVLLQEFDGQRTVRETMSEAIMTWFCDCDTTTTPYVAILIQAILYLRCQPIPKEVTRVDRDRWLDLDFLRAAQAASVCGMYRSALLFAETASGQPTIKSATRRSSVFIEPPKIPVDLQLAIYKNLDEPDSFYGVDRGAGLSSVLDRLDYESDGVKGLLFRGARLDSQIRRSNALESSDSRGMVKSLINLNMSSITHSLLSNDQFRDIGDDVVDSTLHTARKLGQWDIKAPELNHSESSTLFKAFQGLHHARSIDDARLHIDRQLLATVNLLSGRDSSSSLVKTRLRTLAVLTEADEVIHTSDSEQLLDAWDQMKGREKWMRAGE